MLIVWPLPPFVQIIITFGMCYLMMNWFYVTVMLVQSAFYNIKVTRSLCMIILLVAAFNVQVYRVVQKSDNPVLISR